MKKVILLLLLFTFASFTSSESDVYICVSKGAKRYHFTKTCKGLSNCKHTIKKVTLDEAKEMGLTLCGWED